LALPEEDRFELAEALLASQDQSSELPFDPAWLGEIQRRSAEIEAGSVPLTPWSVVRERVRQQLKGRRVAGVTIHPEAEAEYEAIGRGYLALVGWALPTIPEKDGGQYPPDNCAEDGVVTPELREQSQENWATGLARG
jgi:putative addiction module component (TIGR02574 family)